LIRALTCIALLALLATPRVSGSATAAQLPARPAARGRPRPVAPARAPAQVPAGARTLEDIHIEGEIAVPQVLFITARDQRRFMEFQDRRYLRSSAQLGAASVLPGWMIVSHTPHTAGKEIAQ
jgi:hypothetical protein